MKSVLFIFLVLPFLGITEAKATAIPLPIQPGAVNILMVYTRTPSDNHYVRNEQALASYSAIQGFNVLDSELGDGTVFMRNYSIARYWNISAEGKLVYVTSTATATPFLLLPIAEGADQFTATYNGVPLVTSRSTPPFDFFLQTRYPSEPPATFRFIPEFDVAGSYAGNRANIMRTLDFISEIGRAHV